jgi:hypothetical protein
MRQAKRAELNFSTGRYAQNGRPSQIGQPEMQCISALTHLNHLTLSNVPGGFFERKRRAAPDDTVSP